ncbi:MAG: hypothetical protein JOZ19_02930 [Rubrobacter sp.]|nr:hypothetical protein [Rubrobacter sp.]
MKSVQYRVLAVFTARASEPRLACQQAQGVSRDERPNLRRAVRTLKARELV